MRSRAVSAKIAEPLGTTTAQAADSILVLAAEEMRGLLTDMTVAQGRDARDCLLVAGGGAAGLDIVQIARELGIRHFSSRKLAAGLGAVGGQYSDITAGFSRGHHTVSSDFDFGGVNAALQEIEAEIDAFFVDVQHPGEHLRRFRCEARYDQQMWEIDVEMGDRSSFVDASDVAWLQDRFDAEHLDLFAVNQQRARRSRSSRGSGRPGWCGASPH